MDKFSTAIDLPVLSVDPPSPSVGYARWYSKADGKAYQKDAGGVVTEITNETGESPLTFSDGLTRTVDTIKNDLNTGKAGGQTIVGGTASGDDLTISSTTNGTKGNINFGTSTYDEVNNRLGIGTTSPISKFDVDAGTAATPNAFNIYGTTSGTSSVFGRISNTNLTGSSLFALGETFSDTLTPFRIVRHNTLSATPSRIDIWNTESGTMAFATNNVERLTILSSGSIGMGTTNPTGSIEINKATAAGLGANLFLRNATSAAAGNAVQISMSANDGGNATSSTAKIVMTEDASAYSKFGFFTYAVDGVVERLTIDNGGNVGIGTISPATKLDVNGTGNFVGDVTVPDEAYGAGWNASLEVPTKNAIYDKIQTLGGGVSLADVYPIGSVYISVVSTNPATLFGIGTWVAFATGRTIVGIDAGQTEFDTVEETGGAKTHTLTVSEMPAHNHVISQVRSATTGVVTTAIARSSDTSSTAGTDITTDDRGGGGEHNNLQPYIITYMWKRTA